MNLRCCCERYFFESFFFFLSDNDILRRKQWEYVRKRPVSWFESCLVLLVFLSKILFHSDPTTQGIDGCTGWVLNDTFIGI
jgi:hypothetical protein